MRKFALLFLLGIYIIANENGTLIAAVNALDRFMALPEERIPPKLLRRAAAIAIVPNLIRGGFVVGARFGKGVLLVKNRNGWSDPVFIKLYGGSLGWQIGLENIDVILIFKNRQNALRLLSNSLTLGGDLSIALGPVGRAGQKATDLGFRAQILSYSRSMGAFAGLALAGSRLEVDYEANAHFYHCDPYKIYQIIQGKCHVTNTYVQVLKEKLREYASWQE
ncbi:lipid-binding SYLF domain-containing protein [Nitratiruptor sp. SB155-2]|uniref:lipid-binding SYLF domain-containing protein n=1 Tax=Nitratiruptor sp. (strain SB155-2) TaxID=387092 RepID=UPI0002E56C36|nr:lipid-binding SYLF domain-containing protein [Nitratiruptor sp. SB155-2]